MTELKQISKSKCYEGDQFVFSHHSEVCDCDMTFGIYIPVHETKEKLRLIWFLSGILELVLACFKVKMICLNGS